VRLDRTDRRSGSLRQFPHFQKVCRLSGSVTRNNPFSAVSTPEATILEAAIYALKMFFIGL
jgi:hypothetical protein